MLGTMHSLLCVSPQALNLSRVVRAEWFPTSKDNWWHFPPVILGKAAYLHHPAVNSVGPWRPKWPGEEWMEIVCSFYEHLTKVPHSTRWHHVSLRLPWSLGGYLVAVPGLGAVCVCVCVCVCVYVCVKLLSHVQLCNPIDCSLPGTSVRGDSPGKNTGVGCQALLQGIFLTQGSNLGLPHCRQIL